MRERRLVVVNAPKPIESDTKRFYMKGAFVEVDCVKCNRPVKLDLSERPLSYPVFNKAFVEHIYCEDCDIDMPVKLILNLSLELVTRKGEP